MAILLGVSIHSHCVTLSTHTEPNSTNQTKPNYAHRTNPQIVDTYTYATALKSKSLMTSYADIGS